MNKLKSQTEDQKYKDDLKDDYIKYGFNRMHPREATEYFKRNYETNNPCPESNIPKSE